MREVERQVGPVSAPDPLKSKIKDASEKACDVQLI
jgi:hypothetical protein